jgi:multicomponent Na+:H+ antiporter subunit A
MMWLLLSLYAVGAVVIVVAGRGDRPGPIVFGVGAAVSTVVAATASLWLVDRTVATAAVEWVPGLGIELAVRVDPLTSLLTLIVAAIGIGVFVYSAGYFAAGTAGLARFSATLLVFSGSMVGLVLSDSIWAMFLFWELTSVTSFLLVGFKNVDAAVRTAARRALVITASGGLVLLAGFVVLQDIEGMARLRDMEPATGFTAGVAAVLVIIAAATKSAQVPFHVWLPGAMAAPTPVSAYLHSATMVKAGVILIAILQPSLGGTDPWTPLLMGFGLASLIWGAIGALRQFDAKLVLAWGTISQLGLMVSLLAVDTAKATFAAIAIVVAHAVFKAALFLVVGEIDVRTGTRDLRELGGLWRRMPITFAVALASALSMAGVPPLLGFTAKEAGIEAALKLDGTEKTMMLIGVVAGSVLTVAYTTRLMVLAFGGRSPAGLTVGPRRWAMSGVEVVLGAASVVGFAVLGTVTGIVRDAAVVLDPAAEVYELLRWPGLTTAFVISLAIVLVGIAVGMLAVRRISRSARPLGALAVDRTIDGTLFVSRAIASRVQHGSLPGYRRPRSSSTWTSMLSWGGTTPRRWDSDY